MMSMIIVYRKRRLEKDGEVSLRQLLESDPAMIIHGLVINPRAYIALSSLVAVLQRQVLCSALPCPALPDDYSLCLRVVAKLQQRTG